MDCVNAAGFFYRPKDTTQGHCNNIILYEPAKQGLLLPTTTVHSYNTRNSAKLNFHRPQVRTNIGKFTFKYSASVIWETVPMALKKTKTFNRFKKLYKAHLISCQSNNICSV